MIGDYQKIQPQQGWQCPICGRVYSPTTMMCLMCLYRDNEKESISTTDTIDYVYHEGITKTEGER